MAELAAIVVVIAFWILLTKLVERRAPMHPGKGILNLSCRESCETKKSKGKSGFTNGRKKIS